MMIQERQESRDEKSISPTCLRTFIGHTGWVEFVAFSGGGKFAISGGDDYSLRVWEVETGLCIRIFKLGEYYGDERHCFTSSSDGTFALVGSQFYPLELLELTTGKRIKQFGNEGIGITALALTRDDKYVLYGKWPSIELRNLATKKRLRIFKLKSEVYVQSAAFSSNPRFALIAFAGKDQAMQFWDLKTGTPKRSFEGHVDHVNSVAISHDGSYAVSGSDDNSLRLWELETGKCIKVLEGHTNSVNAVALSPDGRHILSGSTDDTIRFWDAMTGKCLSVLSGHKGSVKSVAFSHNGMLALSGSHDETIKLWGLS